MLYVNEKKKKSHRVVPPVLCPRGVGATSRHEVAHRQVLRQLEAVAHVGLPPAQDGRVDGDGEGGVAGREGALDQLLSDLAVLLACR